MFPPEHEVQVSVASPEDQKAAKQIQAVVREAAATLAKVRDQLLREVDRFQPGQPPLIDGQPAFDADGTPVSLVEWLRNRLEEPCRRGVLAEAIGDMEAAATDNPLAAVTEYIREDRGWRRSVQTGEL